MFSTSVNYLCLPLRLNTADARARAVFVRNTTAVVRVELYIYINMLCVYGRRTYILGARHTSNHYFVMTNV